ncbi:MAG TPA: redoxin domain-containing protein [Polyangiaceae bacterium]|nr:redoxin domain-containing protein [Polyangiaceae bacterium]
MIRFTPRPLAPAHACAPRSDRLGRPGHPDRLGGLGRPDRLGRSDRPGRPDPSDGPGRSDRLGRLGRRDALASLASLAALPALYGCGDDPEGNEPGAPTPSWSLVDFQPQSEGFEQAYGLDRFRGRVLLVALYAGWCNVCIGQASKMDEVEQQFVAEGLDVRFVGINDITANSDLERRLLCDAARFPLFQDTPEVGAWQQLKGTRNDVYIYGPDGILRGYYPIPGSIDIDPHFEPGYNRLRQALYDAR